MKMAEDRVI